MGKKLIRFNWASKKMQYYKANFGIWEGSLSKLLCSDISIESILESGDNKQDECKKYNWVDILVKSQSDELILVEVQHDILPNWKSSKKGRLKSQKMQSWIQTPPTTICHLTTPTLPADKYDRQKRLAEQHYIRH